MSSKQKMLLKQLYADDQMTESEKKAYYNKYFR